MQTSTIPIYETSDELVASANSPQLNDGQQRARLASNAKPANSANEHAPRDNREDAVARAIRETG